MTIVSLANIAPVAIAIQVESGGEHASGARSRPLWAMLLLTGEQIVGLMTLREQVSNSGVESMELLPAKVGLTPCWLPLDRESQVFGCLDTGATVTRTGIQFEAIDQSTDEPISTVELAWESLIELLANRVAGEESGNGRWLTNSLMLVLYWSYCWSDDGAIASLWDAIGEEVEYEGGHKEPVGEPDILTRLRDFLPSLPLPA